jgi:hypothetical protein
MRVLIAMLSATLFSAGALAGGYMEKKSGDLSDDGLMPTAVKLKAGPNVIAGKYGTSSSGVTDRDYFTIKIMSGQTLDSIILEPETQVGLNVSFIGVQAGKKVTVPPVGGSPEDLLGWTHYGTLDEGTDILPAIGEGSGAIGFTPPLGPGTYSFWVQETAVCKCQYRFTFNVGAAAQ